MSSYTECETQDYGLTKDESYYAKLFSTKTNINGSNHYNDCQIFFRVYHASSTGGVCMPKNFAMSFVRGDDENDIVKFIDLNPEETRFDIKYTIDVNGNVTVYGKGTIQGAKLKVQVLYSPTLSMFEFHNAESFTNNITELISPITYLSKDKKNEKINSSAFITEIRADNLYSKILNIVPYYDTPVFTISFLVTEIPTSTLIGFSKLITVTYNGTIASISNSTSNNADNGLVTTVVLNSDNTIDIFLKSTTYGKVLITPITFYCGDNTYFKYINGSLSSSISGTLLIEK